MKKLHYLVAASAGVLLAGSLHTASAAPALDGYIVPASSIEQPSDHGVRAHTNCIGMKPVAGQVGPQVKRPQSSAMLRAIYNQPDDGGSGTIAIVDAFDEPAGLSDFNDYATANSLPLESSTNVLASTNTVFQIVYASGNKPTSGVHSGWNIEEALDIESAHGMAPEAKIVLVEANSDSFSDLFAAVAVAAALPHVREVTMSWGGGEFSGETSFDSAFTKHGVVFFASSGDDGLGTIYPSTSPKVVCVGGTTINDTSGGAFNSETGWSGSGGGESSVWARPVYQAKIAGKVGTSRGCPDIAAEADPNSGLTIYISGATSTWGGTSLASPLCAAMHNNSTSHSATSFAEHTKLYAGLKTSAFRDIVIGNNGAPCKVGWDFVTGIGSPNGDTGF